MESIAGALARKLREHVDDGNIVGEQAKSDVIAAAEIFEYMDRHLAAAAPTLYQRGTDDN